MIMCGLKKQNSTVKAKQAVMDVAYYNLLKGSTANAWVKEMDGAVYCTGPANQIQSLNILNAFGEEGNANWVVNSCALYSRSLIMSAKEVIVTLFSQNSHIYVLSIPLSVTIVHNHMQTFCRQLALMILWFDLISRRQNQG